MKQSDFCEESQGGINYGLGSDTILPYVSKKTMFMFFFLYFNLPRQLQKNNIKKTLIQQNYFKLTLYYMYYSFVLL